MRKLSNSELNRISPEEFKEVAKVPITIVLDNIRSLSNIGSVFRTSDAFRIEAVYLCGITACPPNKEIQKTALGATESVYWKYFSETINAIEDLKMNNYSILAIEQAEGSVMLQDFSLKENSKIALVFGNEVKGVEDEVMKLSDVCIEIPQFGTKHSLNISVSVGIVIWDLFKKMNPDFSN
jgi:tRNA G18 (ribose-2'-O)-methylase SpoU